MVKGINNAFDHYGILLGIKSDNELKMVHQCLLLAMLVLKLAFKMVASTCYPQQDLSRYRIDHLTVPCP